MNADLVANHCLSLSCCHFLLFIPIGKKWKCQTTAWALQFLNLDSCSTFHVPFNLVFYLGKTVAFMSNSDHRIQQVLALQYVAVMLCFCNHCHLGIIFSSLGINYYFYHLGSCVSHIYTGVH